VHHRKWIEDNVDYESSFFNKKLTKEIKKFMNQKRVARICWNTNQWVKPSGRSGKSTTKKVYESDHGYGFEEWLFDFMKPIDGYNYGFLQPINNSKKEYTGTFDIRLYTIHDGSRYWVADMFNVSILNAEEKAAIESIYEANNWIQSIKNDLQAKGLAFDKFSLNIRFNKKDVHQFTPLIKIDPEEKICKSNRYTFLTESFYPNA
jgi:hypothetical protein